jgi:hypothetical protein
VPSGQVVLTVSARRRQQSVLKCKLDMAALMDCLRGIEAPAEVLLSRAVELAKQDKVLPG